MNVVNDLFFELLQVVIGNRQSLSRVPTPEEWEEIYEMSKKQSLAGIAFAGVERLPQEQMPPGKRIRQWAVKAEKIREHNSRLTKESAQICRYFEQNGFDCVILKGQGNFAYYPEWLQGLRSAGDIDVWCWPKGNANDTQSEIATIRERGSLRYGASAYENELREARLEHPIRAVIEFCLSKKRGEYVYYHNLDFPVLKATPVEVHYRPTWLYNPFRNRVLQKWFASQKVISNKEEVKSAYAEYDGYKIPSVEFNVVFQLLHLYKHIFEEGIGLRQLLDYYFVVQNVNDNDTQAEPATIREHGSLRYGASAYDNEDKVQGTKYKVQECKNLLNQRAEASDLNSLNSEASAEVLNQRGARLELFKKLGLKEFAGAVMYVMREVFAMPEERMLCRPDEKRGRKLLEEIMIGGNFGKFDERYNWAETTNGSMDYRGASYAFARLRHNFQFLRDYPSEVLWEPVFRVYHWVWRKFQLWKY